MTFAARFSIKRFLFLFLTCWVAFSAALAAPPPVQDVVAQVRARIQNDFASSVPGLSVAVAEDGKLIWSEGFGFADIEAKKPVTPRTLFRIGSISKPITSAGLMLLVEKGKLDLDADIHRYLPDFPDKGHPITTRQLAGHLAGIRHYKGDEVYLNHHYATVRESLTIFENDPLLSVPGERYSYSSYGFNLISAVMEGASGQQFLPYMNAAVFSPLGLTNTMADDVTRVIPERTRYYKTNATGGFELEPDVDNSYKWASGGFISTPEDLVRFGSAHLRAGFLTQASLDTLFTPQKTKSGKSTGYGIGWFIARDKHGHPIWSHSGGSVGGTSILMIEPDTRTVMAMTANLTAAQLHDKGHPQELIEAFSALFPASN
jgi:serine beta-lactamase-like protein LACTB, mitochondrial